MIDSGNRLRFSARVLALVALMLALGSVGIARADHRQRSDSLERRADAARARAADAREHERAIAGGIASQSARIDELESEIGVLGGEVAQLESELDRSKSLLRSLETKLAEKTRALARARQQVEIAQRRLSRRVVDIYTSDEPDALVVALAADSLEDLMSVFEVRARVIEQDTSLAQEIAEVRARVARERARTRELRQKRAAEVARTQRKTDDRRATVATLVSRRDALTELRSVRQRSLATVQVERREWEGQADALEAESARLSTLIAAAPPLVAPAEAPESIPAPTTPEVAPAPVAPPASGFIWPVRGTVVSPYGQRWGRLHSGIDIAAPAGTPIAASSSGQVIYAGSMSGYGLIVVIQHAGGIATAYAHNSSLSVSVGQSVTQGQTIAAVGCTGRCYGDHVHFEVRSGGSPVDPLAYL